MKLYDDESAVRPLSEREKQVLELVARGYKHRKIAQELGITTHTVKNHSSNILAKLHALNAAHAVYMTFGKKKRKK